MTFSADDEILVLGNCGREPLPDEFPYPEHPANIAEALEVCRGALVEAIAAGMGDDVEALTDIDSPEAEALVKGYWPHTIGLALIDALRRELDADGDRFQFSMYRTSGFGIIHVDLAEHPGHPGYDERIAEVEEPSVDEKIATFERMLESTQGSIAKHVDELAALLTEADTPDRQYRIDAKNRAIDGFTRMADGMRRHLERLRRGDDAGEP